MEDMGGIVKMILEIVGAFYVMISTIAVVTPTKKDDEIVTFLDRVGAIADRFGLQSKNPFKKKKKKKS